MSILIKDMAMPKNCEECIFSEGDGYIRECVFMPHIPSLFFEFGEVLKNKTIAEWCPLIEQKKGKWGVISKEGNIYQCSNCGNISRLGNYCPNCGARMVNNEHTD